MEGASPCSRNQVLPWKSLPVAISSHKDGACQHKEAHVFQFWFEPSLHREPIHILNTGKDNQEKDVA